jgi:integrase
MKTHLTDTACQAAKTKGDKLTKLNDGGGLYLYVWPTAKVWYFRYKHPKTLKDTIAAIKPYPAMKLGEARIERDRLKALVDGGLDPHTVKADIRKDKVANATKTFHAMSEAWFESEMVNFKPPMAPRTLTKNRFLLNRLQSDLGAYLITDLTTKHVFEMVANVRRDLSLDYAGRVTRFTSRILQWCIAQDLIKYDVAQPVLKQLATTSKRVGDRKQHRPAVTRSGTDKQKLGKVVKLWRDINRYNGVFGREALKFTVLTMVRPGECTNAEWSEVDWDERVWVIPAAKMKMRLEHHVPLSDQAFALLKRMHKLTGKGRWIFSADGAERKLFGGTVDQGMSEVALNKALRSLGYDTAAEQCAHGLRAVASTMLNSEVRDDDSKRWPSEIIELQLAHVDSDTRADYNDATLLKARAKMLQHWADRLDGMARRGDDGRVVAFKAVA